MELVGQLNGVMFVDDSKGTNVGAVVKSLEGFARGPGKVAVILGGRDKGGSYAPLVPLCKTVCRAAVLIGESKDRIADALGNAVPIERAATLEDAVARASAACQPGDTVLLSPACSSYDMFRDYKERGDRFRAAALALGAVPPAGAGQGGHHA
jgi:UDP-N-acetylmuramoylalanine--D-glutamate ligase